MSYVTIGRFKLQALGQTVSYSEYPFPGGSLSSLNGGATGVQIADWQGTVRGFFNYTGGVVGSTGAHAPFGEAYAYAGGHPGSFTGQQNDGNMSPTTYYFPERQYPSSQGRWLTPDPAGISAVDPSNPQSWNRYAYVLNNPLSATDPLGLYCNWGNGQWDDLDGGATEEDCTNQGGKWIDGMSPSEILEQLQEQGTPLFQTEGWGTTGPGDSSVESSALGDADPANNGTPQNPTTAHCVGQALAAKGLSIALDIAGAVPAFGNLFSGTVEGIQALNAGYYGTVALANAGNTLLNPSASGAASTAATIGLTVGSLALNGSKVIPVVGNLVSLGTAVYDTTKAVQAYQQCMAGGG